MIAKRMVPATPQVNHTSNFRGTGIVRGRDIAWMACEVVWRDGVVEDAATAIVVSFLSAETMCWRDEEGGDRLSLCGLGLTHQVYAARRVHGSKKCHAFEVTFVKDCYL